MNTSSTQWPAISILVMGYGQEPFIRKTVQSVFDQKYEGELEIILCDDRSPDATYEIMKEMAESYSGPHRVIHHRAETNGRVAINMNRAVALSSHPWLMRVDGDDILHPDRARLTALAIMRYPDVKAISGHLVPFSDEPAPVTNPSDDELIFVESRASDLDKNKNTHGVEWWGCMMTMSRDIFTEFGDLPAECAVLDDTMFATRALMLGSFVIVKNGTMLYYRRHAGNISSARSELHTAREFYLADKASRDYYRRGCICHEAILSELRTRAEAHAERSDLAGLLRHFEQRFDQLRHLGYFWEMPWKKRRHLHHAGLIARCSWAIQTAHPYLHALGLWLKKR